MPSLVNDVQPQTVAASPSTIFDQPPRKSHDKTSIGNAFLWTSDVNGEDGHADASSDRFVTDLKGSSLPSLPTARSGITSQSREWGQSGENGSVLSLATGSERDRGGNKDTGRTSRTPDEPMKKGFLDRGAGLSDIATDPSVNVMSPRPRSSFS